MLRQIDFRNFSTLILKFQQIDSKSFRILNHENTLKVLTLVKERILMTKIAMRNCANFIKYFADGYFEIVNLCNL